ncbi:MAG: ATP-grasp domain-containing protein [Methermicoccaceae archaeon]
MCSDRVAIVGSNVRHVVLSAVRAGFEVWAFDGYLDRDLLSLSRETFFFKDMKGALLHALELVKRGVCDSFVLASGIETSAGLDVSLPLNPPMPLMLRASDKLALSSVLDGLDIPTPEVFTPSNVSYPAVVKPRFGAGGRYVKVVSSDEQLRAAMRDIVSAGAQPVVQRFVEGVRISASVIATRRGARVVCLNEQLSGERFLHAPDMRYCGNISPASCPKQARVERAAERVCEALGLVGSCGVDFVVGDEPWVVEVNPRFQGSLDTAEEALRFSMFRAHVDAFAEKEPRVGSAGREVWARGIYYAPRDVVVKGRLDEVLSRGLELGIFRDVPQKGVSMPRDEPLVSIVVHGSTRGDAIGQLMEISARLDAITG